MFGAGVIAEVLDAGGAAPKRALPPSTQPVPASLADVAGKKYMSSRDDWEKAGFGACIRFEWSSPQYFQYQWEKTSETGGVVHAQGDLDGDGAAETKLDVPVTCTDAPLTCKVGLPTEVR